MAFFNNLCWATFCLFNAIDGLQGPQSTTILPFYHAHQRHSSLELKTDNDQESKELINNNNRFTEQTLSENGSGEYTKPTTIDTAYQYNSSVLTAAKTFRKKSITSDLNNTQKYDDKKEYQKLQNESRDSVESKDSKVTGLDSSAMSATENKILALPPAPARRIYNGHRTKIKHFPFLVTVHVFNKFVCGGSIIKFNLVLTAASCLKRWQVWKIETTKNETAKNETTKNETTKNRITKNETIENETTKNETIKNETTKNETTKNETINNESKMIDTIKNEITKNESKMIDIIKNEITKNKSKMIETIKNEILHNVTTKNETTHNVTTNTVITKNETKSNVTVNKITTVHNPNYTYQILPKQITVRIGTNYYRLEGKVVEVKKVHFHPSYREENLQSNLVILELGTNLTFKHRNVKKINIRTNATAVPNGTHVTIAGWGAKTYYNKVYNALWNLIQKAVLNVSDMDQCIKLYSSKYVNNKTNFCASGKNNEGACNCDAGDPAVVDGLLVGVTSFGSLKCGAPNATTVFTNLGNYTNWINEFVNTTEEESKKTTIKPKEASTSGIHKWPCLRNDENNSGEKCQAQRDSQPNKLRRSREYRRAHEDSTPAIKLGEGTDKDIP